jgi:hypothetical protein
MRKMTRAEWNGEWLLIYVVALPIIAVLAAVALL